MPGDANKVICINFLNLGTKTDFFFSETLLPYLSAQADTTSSRRLWGGN
jgi:hypothetical protein